MKKMRMLPLVLAFGLASVSAKDYLAAKIGGDWSGKGAWNLDMTLIVLDVIEGAVAADLTVGNRDCSGGIAGLGKLRGNVLTLTPYKKEEGGEACVVTITFDASGKAASVSESQCGYYHGAACEFRGSIKRKWP